MEGIIEKKDFSAEYQRSKSKSIEDTGENLTGSSGLPLPPIPAKSKKENLVKQEYKVNSLLIEQKGYIFYPSIDTLSKFILEFNPIKINNNLLIIYEPKIKEGSSRIEFHLILQPVQWLTSDPYPTFESVEDEIKFHNTHFFVVLNGETHSYSPDHLPDLRKLVKHPLLKVLIFDERLAIHMDLDLPNYYYCRWSDLNEGFLWLTNTIMGRLSTQLVRKEDLSLSPLATPPAPEQYSYLEDFDIFSEWKVCSKHGPTEPEMEFVRCKKCESLLCLPCYKEIDQQMLCPGSLFRNQDYHQFST
ncbi:MAG: hypothetical protein HeimC3_03910 [Candidatus Heimdallarchaeota archaeon LC_3]|nr:MAG: hypothetical protein HeimC3_03910 [Candidatus Heimdallarchaeota archaeon LC_3]